LTPRALQRRLKDRGTSYVRILDGSRRDLALKYLSVASLSIGEISFLLHFSDLAAFNHAFKRWTATTAGQYRAELWTKPAPGMPPGPRTSSAPGR
jgi:AraC-like DNA-binding protein